MADTEANDKKYPESWGDHNGSYYQVIGGLAISKNTSWGCVYGSTFVSEGIHEWVIKYEHTEDSHEGFIGIATHNGKTTDSPWNAIMFGLYHHQKILVHSVNPSSKTEKELEMMLKDGDTIRIVLNYEKKTVSFYDKNNAELWTQTDIPTGHDKVYRLCVGTNVNGAKYTIIHYFDMYLNIISNDLKSVNQKLTVWDEKIKFLNMDQLIKFKTNTIVLLDECKEFEENFENFKNHIHSLNKNIKGDFEADFNKNANEILKKKHEMQAIDNTKIDAEIGTESQAQSKYIATGANVNMDKIMEEMKELREEIEQMKAAQNVNGSNKSSDGLEQIKFFFANEINLPEYIDIIIGSGFNTMELLCTITHDDLKEIGCRIAHRKIILFALRDKWHK